MNNTNTAHLNAGDWISLARAAKIIGVSKRQVTNYVRSGTLKAASIDGFWVVLRADAEMFTRPKMGRPRKA